MLELISRCEDEFKGNLDRYKYAPRYENVDPLEHRAKAVIFLEELNERLSKSKYLYGSRKALADMAIAPFIRQFANVDRAWFDQTDYEHVKNWLYEFLESDNFKAILKKYPVWQNGDPVTLFPDQAS